MNFILEEKMKERVSMDMEMMQKDILSLQMQF